VIKKFEKHIGQRIREKMHDWADWKHLKFQATHNNGPLQFQSGHDDIISIHRGNLVGFVIHHNNV